MSDVTRTERGWAGHFCGAHRCRFRRNTLLECGERRVVVSTVGIMMDAEGVGLDDLGGGRMYETMAFEATREGSYWDADVSRQLHVEGEWYIAGQVDHGSDEQANAMHERIVADFTARLAAGEPLAQQSA